MLINNSRSKQKENLTHPFIDIGRAETCTKFQQKILNSTVVEARQSFQFFRQIISFLVIKRALLKFKYWILHRLISIIKLQNNYSVKPNFILTTRATLEAILHACFCWFSIFSSFLFLGNCSYFTSLM